MALVKTWEHFFKPEVRNQGEEAVAEGIVVLSQASDTSITSYAKGSTPVRTSFLADSIASKTFTVDCSCSHSGRGQLCKHIWATLLLVEEKYPDFLDSKEDLVKGTHLQKKQAAAAPKSQAQIGLQAAFKVKQADYRKQQYLKQKEYQKQRSKNLKEEKLKQKRGGAAAAQANYPEPVAEAVAYFAENGFEMEYPFDEEVLRTAKKQLSRVFHPDKGGSHDEILALNQNFEILKAFIES